MLLSMTGFGEAHRQNASLAVTAEVRTINSRYFKLVVRCGEGYTALEPLVENLVREHIKRGTVQVSLRITRVHGSEDYKLDAAVLGGYRRQLEELYKAWNIRQPIGVDSLLALPGVVVQDAAATLDVEREVHPVEPEGVEGRVVQRGRQRVPSRVTDDGREPGRPGDELAHRRQPQPSSRRMHSCLARSNSDAVLAKVCAPVTPPSLVRT